MKRVTDEEACMRSREQLEQSTCCIGDLLAQGILEIGDGYRAKNSELGSTGLPFARAANINEGFHFQSADRFPIERVNCVGNKISRPGDVVFTSKGTVGRFAFVSEKIERFLYSPQLCFWRSLDEKQLVPRFLYYWMQSEECLYQINYLKGQTDMADYVSLRDQRRMRITVPSCEVQTAIVETLGVFDDKIALLRETNATLEAIAQAIFKSWFVDFDPVRAKAEGCDPEGVPPEVADLFPKEFEDSKLGSIPKGWHSMPFVGAIDVIGGGTPKTSIEAYWNGDIPWFSVVDAPREGDVYVLDTEKHITAEGVANSSTRLLRPGTTVISARGTVGKTALVGREMAMNQSCYGLQGRYIGDVQTYFATRRLVSELKQRSHGSVFETITRDTLASVSVVVAPPKISEAFESLVGTLLVRVKNNVAEVGNLADLRDTLLPRLMSGKLQTSEEMIVGVSQ